MPSCSCAPEAGVDAGLCLPCPVLSQSHRVASAGCGQEHKTPGGERGLQEAAEAGLRGPGTGLPAWAVGKRPRPKDGKLTGRGGELTPVYMSVTRRACAARRGGSFSGGGVKEAIDHVAHLLHAVLDVLLWVLGEGHAAIPERHWGQG